ncbi:MAG: HigA family addiction module antidote protein [Spirochaetaceae bacterium]|jgi:addiction module HigA family antidote|nr:HigA family addiction module antidote protein [Spirochaetaceae bacterium]
MAKKTLLIPGDELNKLLKDYNIPISALAGDIGLSVSAVRQIVTNKAKISLHIAKRLAKYFSDTTVEYWVNMQTAFDLAELEKDPQLAEVLKTIPKAKKLAPPPAPEKAKKTPKKEPKKGEKVEKGEKNTAPKAPRKPRAKKAKPETVEE